MPGHIKKSEGADPDPDPWLVVSEELRKKLNSKPYDAKKSCWVPDKATGGYWEGLIESKDGDKVTVKIKEDGSVSFNPFYIYLLKLTFKTIGSLVWSIYHLFDTKLYHHFRLKFLRRTKLARSIRQNLIVKMICQD